MAFSFWLFLSLNFISGKDQTSGRLILIHLWKKASENTNVPTFILYEITFMSTADLRHLN